MTLTTEAAKIHGRPFMPASTQSERMEQFGFINVTERWEIWPFSPWHSDKDKHEFGLFFKFSIQEFLMSYSVALLTRYMGMKKLDVEDLCNRVEQELNQNGKYWDKAWFIYGQKPLE